MNDNKKKNGKRNWKKIKEITEFKRKGKKKRKLVSNRIEKKKGKI